MFYIILRDLSVCRWR